MNRFFFLVVVAAGLPIHAQESPAQRASWNQPVSPFRIVGNVYHVGVTGVSAFLIATPAGAILLDGGFPETAPAIEKNISALGFRIEDVRILLNSHAHYDHCGGLTELKQRTHATLVASAGDSRLSNGVRKLACSLPDDSRIAGDSLFSPPDVDRIVDDNQTVELGGVKLAAHLTPGHTKGCTTWTMTASDAGRRYNVVFYCSTTVAGNRLVNNPAYPNIASDFENTFAKLRQLPCDVFLAPHGSLFHLHEKIALLNAGHQDAFVDSNELQAYVARSEQEFREELAKQRAKAR